MKRAFCSCLLLIASLGANAAEPAHPLDKSLSRYAKYGKMKVHYKSLGKGETALVFVHGWTADLHSWRHQAPAFEGKVRQIFIDLPGHGKSDKPKIDYTMDVFARAIDAVLIDAGVTKVVLAGHSMGTPVVRQYYRRYPKKVLGLIAVDGRLQKWHPGEAAFKQLEGPNFKETVGKHIEAWATKDTSKEVRKFLGRYPTAPQHVAVSALRLMFHESCWDEAPIKVPVQHIVAKAPHWTIEYEKYVRKLAPHIDYQVMSGVSHFLILEKPREFNALVLGFLKKNRIVKLQ